MALMRAGDDLRIGDGSQFLNFRREGWGRSFQVQTYRGRCIFCRGRIGRCRRTVLA